jgi:hypothetical protein
MQVVKSFLLIILYYLTFDAYVIAYFTSIIYDNTCTLITHNFFLLLLISMQNIYSLFLLNAYINLIIIYL